LKAGGAYLPINPEYPEERVKYMLADSGVEVLVTTPKLQVLEVFPSTLTSTCQVSPTNLAYITYTSGSTGKPKGVMVEHRGVVRLVKNTNYMEFKRGDKLLPTGALEFDVSTFETWGALLNGLSLYLLNKEEILAIDKFKEFAWKYRVDIMWLTSPLFNQVVQTGIDIFAGLKRLLVGGEALSPVHINQLRKRYPRLSVINGYGPTENTTFSTTFEIDAEYKNNIPIGKPIANSTAYIVGKYHNLQPIGLVGELWVGGDGIARGYLNNPELTAEKFLSVSNKSYRSYMTYISKKIYKTGDLTRWLPDGNIEFLGRVDHQVKVRGFRIELGEIENQLLNHEKVKEAKVLAKEASDGNKYLAAYILLSGVGTPGKKPVIPALREYLSQALPDHMVPSHFIFLEKMPLNPAGKVDRKSLPDPGESRPELTVSYLEPQTDVEVKIASIWKEVLGIDKVGLYDNFFELGGTSLKLVQVYTRLKDIVQKDITPLHLFRYTNIISLARYVSREEGEDNSTNDNLAKVINRGKDKLKNLRKKARAY
jgi:surfactin family lipopeptide synthetase A